MFLHHPGIRSALSQPARIDLFGIDGLAEGTGLPSISDRLFEPATPQQVVGADNDEIIALHEVWVALGRVSELMR